MMGADPNAIGGADAGVTPAVVPGAVPNARAHRGGGHSKWSVEVGYIEVYNERVSDLLAKRKKGSREEVFVDVREHPTRGVFIEGQELREVSSLDEVLGLIEAGNRVRHTAATKMTTAAAAATQSSCCCCARRGRWQTATGQTITTAGKNSRMNLVDLAGSERVAQSEVVGQQFSEARHINLSLTTLGRVIDMLADMTKNKDSQWSMPPYRESKLTFLLKDSLGGNSKTFMIATVSPSAMNYEETLSTLRYASRARDIVNVTKVNEDPRARRIRELEEQMEQMRKDIQGKDPAYVAELEEKLRLLEAEAQKRAADLQALEREREKNEIREKMLRVTEAERQELLSRAGALERQTIELSRNNEKLLREREEKERRLLEQMRRREAEMENNQERWNTALERERVLVLQLRRDCDFYRVQLEAMESRYGLTVDHMEYLVEFLRIFYEKGAASLMNCQMTQLRDSEAKWVSSMKALRKDHDNVAVERARLSESLRTMEAKNKELDAANEALAVQLAQVEGEILRLQDRLKNTVSDRDALAEHLQVIEVTKAELESLYNEANKKCEEFERKLNSPPVCTHHSKKFEGEEWDALLHDRPSELLDVFTNDVSTACRVSKDSVNNVTFALGGLTCEFDVTHDADTTPADIDKRIAEHPFYLMQQLYDNRYGEKKGIDRATDEIKRLERQLQKIVKDSDEKAQKIEEIEKQKEELVQENHKQKETNNILQKELATNAEIHEKIVKQLQDAINNNTSLTNTLQNLEKTHKNIERELELVTAEREELAENLRATEDAKAEVERNLESVTAEREELAENLRATEDAKAEVERNLESVTAEREELAENLRATEDAKAEVEGTSSP
ncbi:kinesin, putative [Trypanosoma cruzi]|nr:kinesin, putative [Trypanosoma cruzi]